MIYFWDHQQRLKYKPVETRTSDNGSLQIQRATDISADFWGSGCSQSYDWNLRNQSNNQLKMLPQSLVFLHFVISKNQDKNREEI